MRSSPEILSEELTKRIAGNLHVRGPRWLRRLRVSRFDRRLAAADSGKVLALFADGQREAASRAPAAFPPKKQGHGFKVTSSA